MVRTQAGFTIIEVTIAAAIAMTIFMALATMQSNMAQENRAMTQKLELNDFGRLLSQIMADETLCSCNIKDQPLQTGPVDPATGQPTKFAELPQIYSSCASTPPTVLLSTSGPQAILPVGSRTLPVKGLRVADLLPMPGTTNAYVGYLEVAVADPPNATKPVLVRPVQPVRVRKKFFATGSLLTACGASEEEYVIKTGSRIDNGLGDAADSPLDDGIAQCGAGMTAVSGGWRDENSLTTMPRCPGHYAAVMTNRPDVSGTSWIVKIACHSYTPYVVCYRPNFAGI